MTYVNENRTAGFATHEQDKRREESETVENKKGIENHIKAGEHFALASKLHYEAAKYHSEGDHKMAYQSALFANGHASLAVEYQRQDTKHHILENHGVL